MGRASRTSRFRASTLKHVSDLAGLGLTLKKRQLRRSVSPAAHFRGLEALESRLMLTVTPSLVGGVLTVTGTAGQVNTISVALTTNQNSIVATCDGVAPLSMNLP